MNLVREVDGTAIPVTFSGSQKNGGMSSGQAGITGLSSYPRQLKEGEESYLSKNYDLLAGAYPSSPTELGWWWIPKTAWISIS